MEDEFSENNNEDYDNEDNVFNEVNHNMGMDGQKKLQFAECFAELAVLANYDVVVDDCILDKK